MGLISAPPRIGRPTAQRSRRSSAPIKREHLQRLGKLARRDHLRFFEKRPEYQGRLLAVVLAQGAAQHYYDIKTGNPKPKGVKDLDVWSFFSAIPGQRFPADKRHTYADLGPSALGRQRFDFTGISEFDRRRFTKWQDFEGRHVDLLMRALPATVNADPVEAIRDWLTEGVGMLGRKKPPSKAWLAEQAVVLIDPPGRRGRIVWKGRDEPAMRRALFSPR